MRSVPPGNLGIWSDPPDGDCPIEPDIGGPTDPMEFDPEDWEPEAQELTILNEGNSELTVQLSSDRRSTVISYQSVSRLPAVHAEPQTTSPQVMAVKAGRARLQPSLARSQQSVVSGSGVAVGGHAPRTQPGSPHSSPASSAHS